MKAVSRYVMAGVVAGMLIAAQSLWAGECCDKTTKQVKEGKACEKCVKAACCKETAAKVTKAGDAKACEKCAKKS